MPAFGSSDAQKEAQGYSREAGNWNFGQYKNWLNQATAKGAQGDALTQKVNDNNFNRTQVGFAQPDQITSRGQQIMPGVQGTIDTGNSRLQGVQDSFSALPGAGQTMGTIQQNLDDAGRQIGGNYDAIQNDINGTYGAAGQREAAGHQTVVDDLTGRYAALNKNVDTAYGDLRGKNASTGAEMQQNAELLRPGSQFQQGQVARAFAPEISNTLQRLRRSGVDPNSVQAVGALNSVERDRARGMDDAAAKGTAGYVDAINRLKSQQLNNEIGLGTDQVDKTTNLGREQGNAYRDEVTRNTGAQTGLDLSKMDNSVKNRDTAFTRGQDYYSKKNDAALLDRNLNQQDWGTNANLARERNANDVNNLGLLDTQYQRGLQWTANDLTEKNSAWNQLGAQGNQDTANAFQAANTARGFGNDASQNYATTFAQESPNANWGGKMLAGVAGGLLNAVAPGAGGGFTSYASGGQPQQGGRAGGSGGGTSGGGLFGSSMNPYIMSAQQYSTDQPKWGSSQPLYQNNPYDPSKTKTLADGSLQVGKF